MLCLVSSNLSVHVAILSSELDRNFSYFLIWMNQLELPDVIFGSATKMIQAKSLSAVVNLADNPPLTPQVSLETSDPLTLYIARVPGSRGSPPPLGRLSN